MKRVLALLLIGLFGFHSSSFAAIIDERKTDVYFANGVNVTEFSAWNIINFRINPLIKKRLYNGSGAAIKKDIAKFDLAYNSTFSDTLGNAGVILDIMEAYEQLNNTSMGWKLFNVIKEIAWEFGAKKLTWNKYAKQKIKDFIIEKGLPEAVALFVQVKLTEKDFARIRKLSKATINAVITNAHDGDLKKQNKAYLESIESGHGVAVIAHSQGNLFALEAFDELTKSPLTKWRKDFFRVISLASPATKVINGGPYMTFDNDTITTIPGSLKGKIPNPLRHIDWTPNDAAMNSTTPGYVLNYPDIVTKQEAKQIQNIVNWNHHDTSHVAFHYFSYYMKTEVTRKGVADFIKASIDDHKKADSQWNKDSDAACSVTCAPESGPLTTCSR